MIYSSVWTDPNECVFIFQAIYGSHGHHIFTTCATCAVVHHSSTPDYNEEVSDPLTEKQWYDMMIWCCPLRQMCLYAGPLCQTLLYGGGHFVLQFLISTSSLLQRARLDRVSSYNEEISPQQTTFTRTASVTLFMIGSFDFLTLCVNSTMRLYWTHFRQFNNSDIDSRCKQGFNSNRSWFQNVWVLIVNRAPFKPEHWSMIEWTNIT